ncbi:MAG: PDZ domain-containing protein [Planctomycetota bacterium]
MGITAGLGWYVYQSYGTMQKPVPFASEKDVPGRDLMVKALTPKYDSTKRESVAIAYDPTVIGTWLNFDWTGSPPPPPTENKPVDTQPKEAPKVHVADLMTPIFFKYDTKDPGGSSVMVQYKGVLASHGAAELRVADALPEPHNGIVVVAIDLDSIEFSFSEEGRENEVLAPNALPEGFIVFVPDGQAPVEITQADMITKGGERVDTRPKETTQLANGVFLIGYEDATYWNENYSSVLANDMRTRTHRGPNGERAGIEVMEVRAGSIAARHGAQSGDVIISINGCPVNSQQEAIQWAKDNGDNYEVFTVVVERLGRLETLTYRKPAQQ